MHIQIHTHTRTHQTSDLSFWTLESITKLCSESNNCPRDHEMFPLFPMIWVRDPLLTWSGNWKMVSPPPGTHHQGNQKASSLHSHMSFYIQKDNKFLKSAGEREPECNAFWKMSFYDQKRSGPAAVHDGNLTSWCWSRAIENQLWRADNDVTLLLQTSVRWAPIRHQKLPKSLPFRFIFQVKCK